MSQLSRLARLRKRRERTLSHAQRRRRLVAGFEPLEDRRLLAITTSFAAGVLTFTGDTGVGIDEKVVLESTATPGTVNYDDGGGLGSTTQAGVNSVVFNGFSGKNEMIIINQGATAFRPIAGGSFDIQFNVNGDPGFDLLRIAGGSAATILSGSYTVSSATSGTISYTTATTPINISFTGLDSTGLTPDEVDDETVQAGALSPTAPLALRMSRSRSARSWTLCSHLRKDPCSSTAATGTITGFSPAEIRMAGSSSSKPFSSSAPARLTPAPSRTS